MKILLAIDLQNDFISGALGTPEALAIIPEAAKRIREFPGKVIFTRDTHNEDYLQTQEGRLLPVPHCIRGTEGWALYPAIGSVQNGAPVIDKPTFGSVALGELLVRMNAAEPIESITLIGLCTDICVIANALLCRAFLPEVPVIVDASCCAGVTPESHRRALEAMRACQTTILND